MSRIELAVIAPPHDLQWTLAGDIEFWQAAWVVKNPQRLPARRVKRFTIIDNQHVTTDLKSTGTTVGLGQLLEAALVLEADEVVLPDVLGDASATLRHLNQYASNEKLFRYRKMFVPQGKTVMDWIECMRAGVQSHGEKFQTIGIPKSLEQLGSETRTALLKYIPKEYDIHMLGIYATFSEMSNGLDWRRVRSWDTSLPIAAAQVPIQIHPQEKYELTDAPVSPSHALDNIKFLQRRLSL